MAGQKGTDVGKRVAVIVEAVQRYDDRLGRVLGQPAAQRQGDAVAGRDTIGG